MYADKMELELMDKVQFIYELALAKLELESLSAKFESTNSMRKFKLLDGIDKIIFVLYNVMVIPVDKND